MKTWNIPELKELSINATAGGWYHQDKTDGPAVWDKTLTNPDTGKKGAWWVPHGDDNAYD